MNNPILKIAGIIFLLLLFIALILTPMHKAKKAAPQLKRPAPAQVQVPAQRGRIAIVIDDWGYHQDNLEIIRQIKQPVTCAILPNLKHSTAVMQELSASGREIILHLPMEPKEKYNLEQNTIMRTMNAGQIHEIFERALASVPLAKGINNHMGSAVTEDKRAAGLVLAEIKKRQLYFLDSFVTSASVCPGIAKQLKVRFAKRDVFLDNQPDPGYIKAQLLKLKKISGKQGMAIGIGHDRRNTLLVLSEILPQMEKEGYRFVFLSQVEK